MKTDWKYKIGGDKLAVLLTLLMFGIFGGVTLWLYRTHNGACIFTGILTALTALILLLSIYRLVFYKVLIFEEGFYYQTGIGNGRYYAYTDVEKAWVSSGQSQDGRQGAYCHIALYHQKVIRFPFFYADEESVEYLVQLANTDTQTKETNAVKEKDEYRMDGKTFGKERLVLGMVILAVVAVINTLLIREIGFQFMIVANTVMGIIVALLLWNYSLFFQVQIEKDGFYCRTTPFNGRYYHYSEIADCREIKRVVRRRVYGNGSPHSHYYFFFEFTDNTGRKHKFQYDQQMYAYEVSILKDRIEAAKGYISRKPRNH